MEKELKEADITWNTVKRTATNRVRWCSIVNALCSTRNVTDEVSKSCTDIILFVPLSSSPSLSVLRHFLCLNPRYVYLVKILQQAATPDVLRLASLPTALWIPIQNLTRYGVLFPRHVPNLFPASVLDINLDRFEAGPLP